MDCGSNDCPVLAMDRRKEIVTIHFAQRKCFNSALSTIINTFHRNGRICNVWDYDGGKALERKKRENP